MGLNHDGDVVDEVIALAVGTIENHGTSGKSKKGEHCKAMDWKSSGKLYGKHSKPLGFTPGIWGFRVDPPAGLEDTRVLTKISKWAWSETILVPQNLRVHQCTNSSYIINHS